MTKFDSSYSFSVWFLCLTVFFFFFFNDTATTEIYTLSLHDALPILTWPCPLPHPCGRALWGFKGPGGLMSQYVAAAPKGALRSDALAGVRTRRIFAVCLDLVIVSVLVAFLWTASVVLTLGMALFFLPPLFPIVAFFYNGLTVSGARMATPGMRAMD